MKKRRKRGRSIVNEMTDDHLSQHFSGHDFLNAGYGEGPNMDRELMRAHWFEHRELIIQKHRKWNSRSPDHIPNPPEYRLDSDRSYPWSFYEFEEPEAVR